MMSETCRIIISYDNIISIIELVDSKFACGCIVTCTELYQILNSIWNDHYKYRRAVVLYDVNSP